MPEEKRRKTKAGIITDLRKKIIIQRIIIAVMAIVIVFMGRCIAVVNNEGVSQNGEKPNWLSFDFVNVDKIRLERLEKAEIPEKIDVQIIGFDSNSRSGTKLEGFNDVVIHYVANPGSSAQANHDYYCNPESEVSSHFIVGLDGEIIQCLPLTEMSAASNKRNVDTISIEVCHPDESGKFNDKTYESLVWLTSWLCETGKLKKDHIIRHYDVTGKLCPKYYVEHEDAWEQFKKDVKK